MIMTRIPESNFIMANFFFFEIQKPSFSDPKGGITELSRPDFSKTLVLV